MNSNIHSLSYLAIVVGPMYASKTTWLVKELNKCFSSGLKVLFINSRQDKRDLQQGKFSTHNPKCKNLPDDMDCRMVTSLTELNVDKYDVIGIDECQWIEDLLLIKEWLKYGKKIYCCGLDGDFNRNPFIKNLNELIPLCNEFTKKTARCVLCEPNIVNASFTKIIVQPPLEGTYVNDCENNSFIPVCNYHYIN